MSSFFKKNNIHKVGEVQMRSKEFYEISDSCAFAILPSCSEGQAGSIIECMGQGLIPVVSKETRLDTDNFGVTLKNSSVKEIKDNVINLSRANAQTIKNRSIITRQDALVNHSEGYFYKRLKQCIQEILR